LYISPDILESPDVASGVCPGVPGEEVTLALTENLIVKTFLKPQGKAALQLKVLNDKLLLDSGDEEDQEVGIIPLPRDCSPSIRIRPAGITPRNRASVLVEIIGFGPVVSWDEGQRSGGGRCRPIRYNTPRPHPAFLRHCAATQEAWWVARRGAACGRGCSGPTER